MRIYDTEAEVEVGGDTYTLDCRCLDLEGEKSYELATPEVRVEYASGLRDFVTFETFALAYAHQLLPVFSSEIDIVQSVMQALREGNLV